MKNNLSLFCCILCCLTHLYSQNLEKPAKDAFLISKMAEKFHIQPKPLDDQMSANIYSSLLESLDDNKLFFTNEDITILSTYQYKIDDEIRNQQSDFLKLLIGNFKLRLLQADTIAENVCKKAFNFYAPEKLTLAEDSSYPANRAAMQTKIYKYLKLYVLNGLIENIDPESVDKSRSKKIIDSLEPILRKKAYRSIHRFVKKIIQSPQGIENVIGNIYCQTFASCYDPHTEYFPPDVKNAFESMLGSKPLAFGFTLTEGDDGKPEIGHLQPGSPAFTCGQLNEGDKILSIAWENQQPIDVSDAEIDELHQILSESGGNKITLNIKKADGTSRQVSLHKEIVESFDEEADNQVKGFLLKGNKSIGYISLPDFYSDWENKTGVNGCANDVAKEILKLKKENIEGLILDLRFNGGGSVQEAVELAGIFIDAGPVAQVKTKAPKIITLKDVNRGTIFDGPLVLLVNGSSASASELVAGTLQDYHRALIVGSRTYGKGTGQVILPMDTTVDLENYKSIKEADSYLKITDMKLFRVTGSTVQKTGVIPDIELPDPADALSGRESDEKFAINASSIEANKYYQPLAPIQFVDAALLIKKEIDSSAYFTKTIQYVKQAKTEKKKKDISLMIDDYLVKSKSRIEPPEADDYPQKNLLFTVGNHAYEQSRINTNKNLKEANDELKENLQNDPYIRAGYIVTKSLIK